MEASHGWWCNSKTIPMTCKYCGDRIFWLSCDCGSSVLFDELGWPWPQHRCAGLAPKPTLSRLGTDDLSATVLSHLDGEKTDEIARLIETNIERDYVQAIRKAAKRTMKPQRQSAWVTRQDPYHNLETTERGIIMEINRDANIFKKAGVDANSIGASMLGKFANMPLVQLTIHTGALAEAEAENCSFTFFVAEGEIEKLKVFRGCLVVSKLRGIVISSRHPIWVCEDLTDLHA